MWSYNVIEQPHPNGRMQLWNILRQSRPFQYWRYACWSLAYTMWTFSRSEGPWTKQRTFFPCRPQISFFFLAKFCFVLFLFPHLRNIALFQESHAMLGLFCVYFAFILSWKINFPNEISKRNLGRLLCEKKFIQPRFKYSLALFVFLTTLNCFGKKWRSFSFRAGKWAEFIYIY